MLLAVQAGAWRTAGDTRERLELLALRIIEQALEGPAQLPEQPQWQPVHDVLDALREQVAPDLDACGAAEINGLLAALCGRFVPAGPSGAPSRGRLDVLPTGRNFYTVDVRNLPTTTAWRLGFASANLILERHLQDHGDHLRQLGLSVWGTATMRTGGDDIAQAMALMGVRPVWATGSQRVDDFEILPLSLLDRPRVDVTLRVSGFFRDAFGNLIRLFDAAVQAVAALDEPDDLNPWPHGCATNAPACRRRAWTPSRRRARRAGGCSGPNQVPTVPACRTPSTAACGTAVTTSPRCTSIMVAMPTVLAMKAPRRAPSSPGAWARCRRCCRIRTTTSTICLIPTITISSRAACWPRRRPCLVEQWPVITAITARSTGRGSVP